MKRISSIFIALFIAAGAFAQVDRTKAPAPGPAPVINIPTPETFTLPNGLKVFVVENHKLPRVSASLTLKVDPVLEKNKAGYVGMTGQIMRRGTISKTKEQLDDTIDFLGGRVNTTHNGAMASSLKKNFEQVFGLMADVVMNPSFPAEELEKIRKEALSSLEANKDDPNEIINNVSAVLNFGKNHPYGEVETEESIKNITLEDLKTYWNTYWKPNVGYLMLVGDINVKEAKKLVTKYFSKWQQGDVPTHSYTLPARPAKTVIAIVDRPTSVQSVINITNPIDLKTASLDNFSVNIMDEILGGGMSGRLFRNLRETHAYTYGAYSSISSDPIVGTFAANASVRNEVTDSAVGEFLNEFKRIRDGLPDSTELGNIKSLVKGSFARSVENPANIARYALNIELYNMPADYYRNYLKYLDAVTANSVKEMAQRYVTPDQTNIIIVGNAKEISKSLARFGAVKYFDINGNEYVPQNVSVDEKLKAEDVIKNYIKAIGGEAKLKAVKDFYLKGSSMIQGQNMTLIQKYKAPDKGLEELKIEAMGLMVQRKLVNGNKVEAMSMGQVIPLEDSDKASAKEGINPFPELAYLNGKYKMEIVGAEKINGRDAVAVEVTSPAGNKVTHYFDMQNWLRVRTMTTEEGEQGPMAVVMDISDYRDVSGIQFPFALNQSAGAMAFKFTIQEVKFNSGLKDTEFK